MVLYQPPYSVFEGTSIGLDGTGFNQKSQLATYIRIMVHVNGQVAVLFPRVYNRNSREVRNMSLASFAYPAS